MKIVYIEGTDALTDLVKWISNFSTMHATTVKVDFN